MPKTFNEFEAMAPTLVCPACGTSAMRVHLRCDMIDRECVTVASCATCGTNFSAEVLPTYQERFERARDEAGRAACGRCRGSERSVRALCDRARRTCTFLVVCAGCGDVQPVADGDALPQAA